MSKKPLNLSVSTDLIKALKHIAIEENVYASELVEEYIKAIKKNKDVIKAIRDINSK